MSVGATRSSVATTMSSGVGATWWTQTKGSNGGSSLWRRVKRFAQPGSASPAARNHSRGLRLGEEGRRLGAGLDAPPAWGRSRCDAGQRPLARRSRRRPGASGASTASTSAGSRSPRPAKGTLATTALTRRSTAARAMASPPLKLDPQSAEASAVHLGPVGQPAQRHPGSRRSGPTGRSRRGARRRSRRGCGGRRRARRCRRRRRSRRSRRAPCGGWPRSRGSSPRPGWGPSPSGRWRSPREHGAVGGGERDVVDRRSHADDARKVRTGACPPVADRRGGPTQPHGAPPVPRRGHRRGPQHQAGPGPRGPRRPQHHPRGGAGRRRRRRARAPRHRRRRRSAGQRLPLPEPHRAGVAFDVPARHPGRASRAPWPSPAGWPPRCWSPPGAPAPTLERASTAPWTRPANEFVAAYGMFTAAEFALDGPAPHARATARRPRQLATVAATIRNNGHVNPEAVYHGRGPFTADDVLRQPDGGRPVPPARLRHDLRGRRGAGAHPGRPRRRPGPTPGAPARGGHRPLRAQLPAPAGVGPRRHATAGPGGGHRRAPGGRGGVRLRRARPGRRRRVRVLRPLLVRDHPPVRGLRLLRGGRGRGLRALGGHRARRPVPGHDRRRARCRSATAARRCS